MTNAEHKGKLDMLVVWVKSIQEELEKLAPELSPIDRLIASFTTTDLTSTNEKLILLGQHSIGENLEQMLGIELCKVCGGPLPLKHSKNREFCSQACRSRNLRMKQDRARQLYSAGKGLGEISIELKSDVTTVYYWITGHKGV